MSPKYANGNPHKWSRPLGTAPAFEGPLGLSRTRQAVLDWPDAAIDNPQARGWNMAELTQESCVPCRGGVPTLTDGEIAALKPQVPSWKVTEVAGVKRIEREFEFKDFREALDFTVAVGELAEHEGHHPDVHLSWGRVRVETWTHKIKGLHQNDFILAAKTDELYAVRKS